MSFEVWRVKRKNSEAVLTLLMVSMKPKEYIGQLSIEETGDYCYKQTRCQIELKESDMKELAYALKEMELQPSEESPHYFDVSIEYGIAYGGKPATYRMTIPNLIRFLRWSLKPGNLRRMTIESERAPKRPKN